MTYGVLELTEDMYEKVTRENKELRERLRLAEQTRDAAQASANQAVMDRRRAEALRSPLHAVRAFCQWLDMREEYGFTRASGVDADHSPLLRRLLEGIEPLPEPPPRAHSYPWYNLVEKGYDWAHNVWLPPGDSEYNEVLGHPAIVIDQERWAIIRTVDETTWIVAYTMPDVAAIQAWYGANMRGPRPMKLSESRWRVSKDPAREYSPWRVERFELVQSKAIDRRKR